jgi:hypothetical protein
MDFSLNRLGWTVDLPVRFYISFMGLIFCEAKALTSASQN